LTGCLKLSMPKVEIVLPVKLWHSDACAQITFGELERGKFEFLGCSHLCFSCGSELLMDEKRAQRPQKTFPNQRGRVLSCLVTIFIHGQLKSQVISTFSIVRACDHSCLQRRSNSRISVVVLLGNIGSIFSQSWYNHSTLARYPWRKVGKLLRFSLLLLAKAGKRL
jgi:hypothetical protein